MNDINEQLLTAYALNELSAAERAEVEAYLADHPDAVAEVEAIRATAGQLRDELMTELQSTPAFEVHPPLRVRPRWQVPVALAASVAVVSGTYLMLVKTMYEPEATKVTMSNARSVTVEGLLPGNEHRAAAETPFTADATTRLREDAVAEPNELMPGFRAKGEAANRFLRETSRDPAHANDSVLNLELDKGKKEGGKDFADSPNFNLNSSVGGGGGGGAADGGLFGKGSGVGAPVRRDEFGVGAGVNSNGGIVTGNVTGGREFRGSVQVTDARNFRGPTVVDREKKGAFQGRSEPAAPPSGVPAPFGAPGRVEQPPIQQTRVFEGGPGHNTESYDRIIDNSFLDAVGNPLSTFSIDVDTASYSNVRRFLTGGQLPPKDAVRIEELVNYFPYRYEGPTEADKPFAASVEIAACPWNQQNRLVRVGIKGREMPAEQRPASNLVFLIDVSGSMNQPNKLPLVKESLRELVSKLDGRDRVAMVVYAGSSGLVLESTQVGSADTAAVQVLRRKLAEAEKQLSENKERLGDQHPLVQATIRDIKTYQTMITEVEQAQREQPAHLLGVTPGRKAIFDAIDRLEAGGSTNGGAGIELAYLTAQSAFIKDGVNRVILATDGDFNVGVTDQGSLTRMIEEKAKGGVFLSVLGFGMGNTKDSTMEKLADKGNGNYAYIDTLAEARKVLVEQMSGTLVTIAKDVKIQVEFNPAKVQSYRLIGYENRVLAKEDFNNDLKDAGEIGAGHTVTALYEVVPAGMAVNVDEIVKLQLKLVEMKQHRDARAKVLAQPDARSKKLDEEIAQVEAELQRLSKPLQQVDPLKYQNKAPANDSPETLTLKLRYKAPDAPLEQGTSKLLEFPITDAGKGYGQASEDFKFAAAVAGFGMILRDSPHKGTATLAGIAELGGEGKGPDANGYRAEFLELVKKAQAISGK